MMGFFTDNEDIRATGSTYLRIDAFAFFPYVVLFLGVAVLQAIKQPIFPMVLGIARQLVIPASINYFLIVWMGWPMISLFYTIVGVAIISSLVCYWYTRRQIRSLG